MKPTLIALFLFSTSFSFSQKISRLAKPSFSYLDKSWSSASKDEAYYLVAERKLNDTTWKYDTYKISGPLIKSEHFKTRKRDVRNGDFAFYNKKGRVDSILYYNNGLPDKSWYYVNDTGRIYLQKDFVSGNLVKTIDFLHEDSLKQQKSSDTSLSVKEIESDFEGGQAGWIAFMNANFEYPQQAVDNNIQGTVIMQFIVDTEGNVIDPKLYKSVEYYLDTEALRILSISPKWVPATVDGKVVQTYKKQPITFSME